MRARANGRGAMTYSIQFYPEDDPDNEDEVFFLCSIGAWGQVCDLAEGLAEEQFPKLRALTRHGFCLDTQALARECRKAARIRRVDPGVRATLLEIAELTGIGHPSESAAIIDA